MIHTHCPLSEAMLCCQCDTVFTGAMACPSCTSEVILPLAALVKPVEQLEFTTT